MLHVILTRENAALMHSCVLASFSGPAWALPALACLPVLDPCLQELRLEATRLLLEYHTWDYLVLWRSKTSDKYN